MAKKRDARSRDDFRKAADKSRNKVAISLISFLFREARKLSGRGLVSALKDHLECERHTIRVMIGIYCRRRHRLRGTLCPECQALLNYALQRIEKCPFENDKPPCAQCPIHCYKPERREQVRQVMRYAGPRIMIFHPLLALRHYLDQITKKPQKNKR